MKKALKVILMIIIVLIIILFLGILIAYSINPTYDKTDMLTKEQVQQILNKRTELNNIYAKFTREDKVGTMGNLTLYTEYFIKDNMAKSVRMTESGKKKIIQEDKDINKVVWIFETDEVVINQSHMGVFDTFKIYDTFDISESDGFEYLGKTFIDERPVIAIKLDLSNFAKEYIYIDEETGLIAKHIMKSPFIKITNITEIKPGIVTDEDVAFIDYETEYPDYRIVEME